MSRILAVQEHYFTADIEHARQMALIAAVSLEVRDDASEVRQRAAVAALHGLAEGLRTAFLAPPADAQPGGDDACNRLQKSGKAQSINETR